jgi:hypothetical protein
LLDSLSKSKAICAHDNNFSFFFRGQNFPAHASLFPRIPMTAKIITAIANTSSKFSNLAACLTRTPSNSNSCF